MHGTENCLDNWRRVRQHRSRQSSDTSPVQQAPRGMGFKENRPEQQHLTSSKWWKVSSTEVERKCIELMKVCDGIIETARESEVTDASEMR